MLMMAISTSLSHCNKNGETTTTLLRHRRLGSPKRRLIPRSIEQQENRKSQRHRLQGGGTLQDGTECIFDCRGGDCNPCENCMSSETHWSGGKHVCGPVPCLTPGSLCLSGVDLGQPCNLCCSDGFEDCVDVEGCFYDVCFCL